MSIDELRDIVYDLFRTDIYYPPPYCKGLSGFKETSYREWAFDELFRYLTKNTRGSVGFKRLFDLCDEFYELMSEFASRNVLGREQFLAGQSVADDVMDLLSSME
jgi:hypothetical protein